MFGISFSEFIIVIIFALAIINPKDIPAIAKYLTKIFFKAKNIIAQARIECGKVGKELGLDDLQKEVESEVEELKKTTIIDIYGNEHEVHDLDKIRGDLAEDELEEEVEKYNGINKDSDSKPYKKNSRKTKKSKKKI